MKIMSFAHLGSLGVRLHAMGIYAKVLLTQGSPEFRALALVPIPFSNISRR